MFESTLGTGVGHKVKRAEDIPAVWSNYRSGSNKKVMTILGDLALPAYPYTPKMAFSGLSSGCFIG